MHWFVLFVVVFVMVWFSVLASMIVYAISDLRTMLSGIGYELHRLRYSSQQRNMILKESRFSDDDDDDDFWNRRN